MKKKPISDKERLDWLSEVKPAALDYWRGWNIEIVGDGGSDSDIYVERRSLRDCLDAAMRRERGEGR